MSTKYPFNYAQKNISIWCDNKSRQVININHHAYHYAHNRKVGVIRYLADMHSKYAYGFVPNRKERLMHTRKILGWELLHKRKKHSKKHKVHKKKNQKLWIFKSTNRYLVCLCYEKRYTKISKSIS